MLRSILLTCLYVIVFLYHQVCKLSVFPAAEASWCFEDSLSGVHIKPSRGHP